VEGKRRNFEEVRLDLLLAKQKREVAIGTYVRLSNEIQQSRHLALREEAAFQGHDDLISLQAGEGRT
jgi:hypothetical protein